MKKTIALGIIFLSTMGAIAFGVQRYWEANRVHKIVITTGAQEGEYYAFAQALATLVQRHNPKLQLVVRPSQGSAENFDRLERRSADFAIIQNGSPIRPYAQPVAPLFPEIAHLIARKQSGIRSMADLRGKRVALMPAGSGSYQLFWAMGLHYGLTQDNFKAEIMPSGRAYQALHQGQVDALFRVIAPGNKATQTLLQDSDVELVPIDQVASLQLSIPYLEAQQLPRGTYDGARPIPPEDLSVAGVRSLLVAQSQLSPEVVRSLTQILFEKRSELIELYPRAALINPPNADEPLMYSFHAGARAYYTQEQPSFLDRYADVLGLLFSVGTLVISAGWQLRVWMLSQQKDRADRYNLEILELLEKSQNIQDTQTLQKLRDELLKILREVIEDLDNDRITATSFQAFAFPWEMAIVLLHQRELMLVKASDQD
jgi:uncharacterized protein